MAGWSVWSRRGLWLSVPVLLAALSQPVLAQGAFCPENAIRIIVPFPPGGPSDSAARLLTEPLQQALSQNVIVESKPGASGSIGAAFVATQPGNGCTMLLSYDTQGSNPALYPNLPFDTVKDFKSVMLLGTVSNVMVVHPSQPWTSFEQLLAAAKKDGEIAYATGGNGTLAHLTMKLLEQNAGFQMRHVPYRGGAPAVQAVIGGHVPTMFGSVLSVAPSVKDGRIRALLQTGLKRDALLPDVPTLDELGQTGFNIVSWLGVFLPASTPDAKVTRLNAALAAAMRDPALTARFNALGIQVVASSPQELQSFVETEVRRWTDIVKRYEIKAQ